MGGLHQAFKELIDVYKNDTFPNSFQGQHCPHTKLDKSAIRKENYRAISQMTIDIKMFNKIPLN